MYRICDRKPTFPDRKRPHTHLLAASFLLPPLTLAHDRFARRYVTDITTRKDNRHKKLMKLKKDQTANKVHRSGEYLAMEKTMTPEQFAQLKRQFDVDEQAAEKAAEFEYEELEVHIKKIDLEDDIRRRAMEQNIQDSIDNESNKLPAGAKLEKTARVDMKECVTRLDEASDFLDESQQKLDAMQEELKGNENDRNMRSMLILVEGQVEEGERRVEKCLDQLEEQELLLQRALRRKAKEDLVLPLYSPLASSIIESDFSVPLVPLVCAFVVVCTDKVSEKLRFLVDLFDINDDEFLAAQEMTCLVSSVVKVLTAVGFTDRVIDDEEVSPPHAATLRYPRHLTASNTAAPFVHTCMWLTHMRARTPGPLPRPARVLPDERGPPQGNDAVRGPAVVAAVHLAEPLPHRPFRRGLEVRRDVHLPAPDHAPGAPV